ncbi:hypothetical protein VOLCADRAFT_103944 [Volvox carteri f. nagariensis]|uniref:Cyclic nucleotide-binding domain-containing protein n=1 Tax=Volvox carteri f. nagariensis TaxID=3068 RepID=D8TQ74_VOLCA|nr:uncharacterized protein VOLCADRAFT_103944 [Volvox carteri f. nagariensis]EFJ50485.1 hypothetical protein VOLCADRAFT_103944 [Volvox carteri f. nagariensis]|eukprot:XP_002948610.1 hypothetical protein VOLCADRAFT_103944 [Volvox carteri f. nagariensis]
MATTLMGDTIAADVWMRGLRDGDAAVWSRPVRSPRLDAAYAAVHGGTGQPFPDDPLLQQQLQPYRGGSSSRENSPKLKRNNSGKLQGGVEAEGDLRAVGLCQKPFIQSYMCSLSYFFSLWPGPLQWELSRLMSGHILARREVALTRGRPPDRLYFVVQGRGASAQHTTVVVSSSSAMLLSLSRPDFSRAFKEVLDIRQAERLMYLRLHPLMSGLELRDLEAASEVLGLAFFPPGTRLSMYDRFTISMLGPGDIFGLPSTEQALALQLQQSIAAANSSGGGGGGSLFGGGPGGAAAAAEVSYNPTCTAGLSLGSPGGGAGSAGGGGGGGGSSSHTATANVIIESYTQVKVYTVKYSDYLRLPASVQQVLQAHEASGAAANAFRWSYYEGRILGLARMEHRRRDARREQLRRHQNNAARGARGAGDGPTHSAAAAAALDLAERDKQLLNTIPILSASVAVVGGRANGMEQHAANARRAVQAAAAAQQQERAKMRHRRGGGGLSDAEGDPDALLPGGGAGLPSWALPPGGGGTGRLGGGGTASYTNLGTPPATESGAVTAPQASTAGGAGRGKRRSTTGKSGGGGGGGGALQKGRPTTADTVASAAGNASVAGSIAGGHAAGGGGGAATTVAGSSSSLNPLLYKSAHAKALLAVQAAQLSRVLEAEQRNYYANRQPVLHDTAAAAADGSGDDVPYAYDGDASDDDDDDDYDDDDGPPPWNGAYSMWPNYNSDRRGFLRPSAGPTATATAMKAAAVGLTPDSEVVETEEPRSLVVAQTPRQRHMLMFRNAQAMVTAAANSRSWVRPGLPEAIHLPLPATQPAARQPRPSYARPTRPSYHEGSGSGLSASDGGGGGGGGGASSGGDRRRSPLRGIISAGAVGGGRGLPSPLSPAARAAVTLYDTTGAPLSARCNSGGRLPPARPDDRLSRYGSIGRASSAGASGARNLSAGGASGGRIRSAGGAGGGGIAVTSSPADGGVVLPLLPGELALPKPGFGRPAGASSHTGSSADAASLALSELSFAHLGVQEKKPLAGGISGGGAAGKGTAAGAAAAAAAGLPSAADQTAAATSSGTSGGGGEALNVTMRRRGTAAGNPGAGGGVGGVVTNTGTASGASVAAASAVSAAGVAAVAMPSVPSGATAAAGPASLGLTNGGRHGTSLQASGRGGGGGGSGGPRGPMDTEFPLVGLPPAIALGYESLDPFAWAALAAQWPRPTLKQQEPPVGISCLHTNTLRTPPRKSSAVGTGRPGKGLCSGVIATALLPAFSECDDGSQELHHCIIRHARPTDNGHK